MSPLATESFLRKIEIGFLHPAGLVVALAACWFGFAYHKSAFRSIYTAMSKSERFLTIAYAAFIGIVASLLLPLTHRMFEWGIAEHTRLALLFVVVLTPTFTVTIWAAFRASLGRREAAISIPLACLAVYVLFGLVFALSPLTPVE